MTAKQKKFFEVADCRHFNGYKPCDRNSACEISCPLYSPVNEAIAFIHLGALGAVLRSTSLLPALRRKHPNAFIIWITEESALPLLQNNPFIDLVVKVEDLLKINDLEYSTTYVIDKSARAVGIAKQLAAKTRKGFRLHPLHMGILPEDEDAEYLWLLGLDNFEKFHINRKSEQQLTAEALGLPYQRDEYLLRLTIEEKRKSLQLRSQLLSLYPGQYLVGLNTGCSTTLPAKKLSIEFQRKLCQRLLSEGYTVVLLGGGTDDQERNQIIGEGLDVIQSGTTNGLRDGICSMAAMDVVFTGDSLGLHLAIALKKRVIAWFGPTCAHEIDLYDRGQALLAPVSCSPCWQKSCGKSNMCYDQISMEDVLCAIKNEIQFLDHNQRITRLNQDLTV